MITYTYTAKDASTGALIKADVQADSEKAAAKVLIEQGLHPINIEEKNKSGVFGKFGKRVRAKDRVIFTRQLSTLINAGLPLVKSLRTVQDQISSKSLKDIVSSILVSVEGGSTLSSAFGEYPAVFNKIYVSLVAAGESSGTLDKALLRIADQQEKDAAIVAKIRGALIYPVIVLVVILLVVVFMLVTVLPQVGALYKDLHKTLPLLTRILLAMADFLTHLWWLALGCAGLAGYGIWTWMKTEKGSRVLDGLKLNTPLFGKLFKKVYMARFSRTLGTLLGSGIPMLEALATVRDAVSNKLVEDDIDSSISKVRGGKALSETLDKSPRFLILVPQMIKIGEESGAIDEMLGRVASFYEAEVDEEVKNLSTTIEPVLMVIMGVMVGLVIAAVLLPIYGLVGQGF